MLQKVGLDCNNLACMQAQNTIKYTDNQQGPTASHMELAQCYVAAWMGGEFREEWIHVYVCLRPFTAHLKLLQYCQLAITQYKIFFKYKIYDKK